MFLQELPLYRVEGFWWDELQFRQYGTCCMIIIVGMMRLLLYVKQCYISNIQTNRAEGLQCKGAKPFNYCWSPQALQSHIKLCAQCFILAAAYMDLSDLIGILNQHPPKKTPLKWSLTKSCLCTHLHIMSKSSLWVFCQTCFFGRVLFISRALSCQVHLSLHIILKRHCYGHLDLSADDDKTKLWFIFLFFLSCFPAQMSLQRKQFWSAKLSFCNIMCFFVFRLSSFHSQCLYPQAEPEPEVLGPTVVIKKKPQWHWAEHHSSSELLQISFYWLKMYIGSKVMLYSCSYYTMFSVCLHLNFMSVQDKDNSSTEKNKRT